MRVFLFEILHQILHGQAALHFELGVLTVPRAGQRPSSDVGADDFDLATAHHRFALGQDHGQRIGLLTGR